MNIKIKNNNNVTRMYQIDLIDNGVFNSNDKAPDITSSGMKFIIKQIERNGYLKSNDKIVAHPNNYDDIQNISWKIADGNRLDATINIVDNNGFTYSYNVFRY